VIVLGVDALDRAAFVAGARQLIATAVLPEALVFIHGYNVSFDDAARRAAQIAYDLHFEGLTLLYSWASEGAFVRYGVDKENAKWSLPRFRSFLTLVLSELGASHVHAIAHSMGNEVCANGLATFDTSALAPGAATLRQIVFAAPDVDAATFGDLAVQFHGRADHFTLYASSKDKALQASQGYQKYPRAGQAGDGLVIVDGVDTIDASDLDTGFMSHSYIGDHTSILSDVDELIRRGTPADKRERLSTSKHSRGTYWKVMPGVVAT
jgi:esterase/lipase superfamily enzyme